MKLYYSVQNAGDGSAYPRFMESAELTEWDQDKDRSNMWGEPCTGEIVLEGDNIKVTYPNIITKESYYYDIYLDEYTERSEEERQEFINKFFSGKEPEKFEMPNPEIRNTYKVYTVLINGVPAGDRWELIEDD